MLHLLLSIIVFTEILTNVNSAAINVTSKEPSAGNVTQATEDTEDNPETLQEAEVESNRIAVVEGDVVLNDDRSSVTRTWPTLQIAYVISSELADRTAEILKAMKIVSHISCVTFHKRTTEDNYLNFQKSQGCASYVGFNGGNQRVFLGPTCHMGNMVHEIFHALGIAHEHTRKDRDQYISVLSQNIKKGKEKNFHKKQTTNVLGGPYDLTSIMHYGRFVFSRNGLPTIVTHVKDKDKEKAKHMGQRYKVTKLDGQKLRALYHCVSQINQKDDVYF